MATKARNYGGVPVTYVAGETTIEIEKAIKFPQRRRVPFDTVGIDTAVQVWGIAVSDLRIDGQPLNPERGHRIIFTEDGLTEVFEVLPDEGDSVSHLTAADSQHRINTKRIIEGGDA